MPESETRLKSGSISAKRRLTEMSTFGPVLNGVSATIVPDTIMHALYPPALEIEPPNRQMLWHRVSQGNGIRITLRAPEDGYRMLHLSVRSSAPGWRASWFKWTFATRQVRRDRDGRVELKDVLLEEGRTLQILALAGEERTVTLECVAELDTQEQFRELLRGEPAEGIVHRETHFSPDGQTATQKVGSVSSDLGLTLPGDYDFEIVLTDAATKESTTLPVHLRLMHPPANLMSYLPAIFATTPPEVRRLFAPYEERPFFERFLRGFEDAMLPQQAMLANVVRLFDAEETPADFLPWLAKWVGLVLDDNWPELKRRRLIREAIPLYRWRGTRRGLSRYLEIYAGVKPTIYDQPMAGKRLGMNTFLDGETRLGDIPPHSMVITLTVPDLRDVSERLVRTIIEREKPAHVTYTLRIFERASE